MPQLLTAEDHPAWCCEACGEFFRPGDYAHAIPIGVTEEGYVIEGEFRCTSCVEQDKPVQPREQP